MPIKQGAYPAEFRQQIVELAKAGRSHSDLAKEFGCHATSIGALVRQSPIDATGYAAPDAPLTTAERQELLALRRELRQVKQECDILAKACDHGLHTKAKQTRRLLADYRKPGRSCHRSHVQTPASKHQWLLRVA